MKAPYTIREQRLGEPAKLKIICIGAGLTGLNLAYQTRRHLKNVELTIYEKNEVVGGTWFENRYPGCACDIPSHIYQFLWALNPDWSEFYVSAPEILEYVQKVTRDHQLDENVKLCHTVSAAEWHEDRGMWKVTIQDRQSGTEIVDWCDFLVNASGFLNHWHWPDIPGLNSFKGQLQHSASWELGADLKGKRIAVIGNGSSGIQLVAALQPEAEHLFTFIRNPTWVSSAYAQEFAGPDGANFHYRDEQKNEFRNDRSKLVKYCKDVETSMNGGFKYALVDSPEHGQATEIIKNMMLQRLGPDHPLAKKLIPEFGFGCRRPTPGSGYLEALTKPNVRVAFEGIKEVVETGIRTNTGELIELDAIICATGFDVSWKPRFPIVGRNKANLAEQWAERPTSYLSFSVPNFPNYFVFFGPNSPLTQGSAIPTIEHLTKYFIRMVHKMQTQCYKTVEVRQQAVDDFIEHSDTFMKRTVWASKCRSWMKSGKEDGPVLSHPGSRLHWFHMLLEPRWEDFKWTGHDENRFSYLGNGFTTMEEEGRDLAWYMEDPDRGYESVRY